MYIAKPLTGIFPTPLSLGPVAYAFEKFIQIWVSAKLGKMKTDQVF